MAWYLADDSNGIQNVIFSKCKQTQWHSLIGLLLRTLRKILKAMPKIASKRGGLILKERVCSQSEQILSFKSSPQVKMKVFYVNYTL